MENEKKVRQNDTNVAETNVADKENKKELHIVRETFVNSKDGREMFAYIVKGKAYGRDIRVDFVTKDNGGYEVLDIMHSISPDNMILLIHDETMTDDKTGEISKYTVYEACVVDEKGNQITCQIKPQRPSDKSLLNMLLFTM